MSLATWQHDRNRTAATVADTGKGDFMLSLQQRHERRHQCRPGFMSAFGLLRSRPL
jgi:hypothetical protein